MVHNQRAEQTGQGPSRELSAADLLLIASTEAEAIDAIAITVTTENYAVRDGFWGFPATPFPPFLLRTMYLLVLSTD